MTIIPVVQKETGRVVSYMASQGGVGLCFGKTHTEAMTRATVQLMVAAQSKTDKTARTRQTA